MEITPKSVAGTLAAVGALLLIGGALGRGCAPDVSDREKNRILTEQLESLREEHKGVVVARNKQVSSLQDLINSKDSEIGVQADLILKLKDKPTEVRYVIKTVTVFEPVDKPVTVSIKDLPKQKLFGLVTAEGGRIVTDRMTSLDTNADSIPDEVTFTPYSQTFTLDAAIGKSSSSFLLRVQSSYDDTVHEIPLEVDVTGIDEDAPSSKLVRPDLAMQVAGVAGVDILSRDPVAGYAAGISMPWLHPTPVLDFLSPSVMLGTSYRPGESTFIVRGGVTIISYNVGGHG
jgi:hypothetical protein